MGWTYTSYSGGPKGVIDFLFEREKLVGDSPGIRRQVLKASKVGSVVYAAMEVLFDDKPREVIALVILTNLRHKGEIGWKDMSENMGPVESNCPTSILKLLTPTESDWAQQWRDRCWRNAKRASSHRIATGEVICLKSPLKFMDGGEYRVFKKLEDRCRWAALSESETMLGTPIARVRMRPKHQAISERFVSVEAFIASRRRPAPPPVDDTPFVLPDQLTFVPAASAPLQSGLALDW